MAPFVLLETLCFHLLCFFPGLVRTLSRGALHVEQAVKVYFAFTFGTVFIGWILTGRSMVDIKRGRA